MIIFSILLLSCSKEKLNNTSHIGDPAFLSLQGLKCAFGQDSVFCPLIPVPSTGPGTSTGSGTGTGTGSSTGTGTVSDTTPPTVASISPVDSTTGVSVTNSISVTFSESMNTSTLTAQSADGACSGSFQVSADSFSTCIGGTLTSSGNPTFTFSANPNLCVGNSYKVKITTGAKDTAGNALTSDSTSTGFSTQNPIVGIGASGGSGNVQAIAVYCNTLYLGGNFTSVNGQIRGNLAAIDLTNGSATSWAPNPVNSVYELYISGTTLYVGGTFGTISGQSRNYIVSYDLSTGNLTSWNPNITTGASVYTILQIGNTVYIGGSFTMFGATPRNNVAALDAATASLASWNPSATGGGTTVFTLAYSGGIIYAGGQFTNIGGQARNYVGAVDSSTGLANSWNPGLLGGAQVASLALTSSNTIIIAGNFNMSTGCTQNFIAEVDLTTGTSCTSFNPTMVGTLINSIALNSTILYLGGVFTNSGGFARNNLSSVATYDSGDLGWNPSPNNTTIFKVKISGNALYAGGNYTTIAGSSRGGIAAFDLATGSLLP